MIRTPLGLAHIKRPLRELYSHAASLPKSCTLDPDWDKSVDIYPGMGVVLQNTASSGVANIVTLPNGTGDIVYGLIGVFVAPVLGIDEVAAQGVDEVPVWVLSPGSEFEVQTPSFDDGETWTFPTDGTELLVCVQTTGASRGKLVPSGTTNATTKPVARAIARPAANRLIISGLNAGAAY